MPTAVYETIKASQNLPSPTGVGLEIVRLAHDESSTFEDMARVVEKDPAISSRLLKLVNCPYAGLPRQIGSVERAVALLGTRTITGLALGFSLVSNHRQGLCRGFDYEEFWSESLARAVAAKHVAHLSGTFAPDEAFTCGLLSQIGRLAFATAFPDAYIGAIKDVREGDHQALAEVERTVFGIDHNDLAAEMMGEWHLPDIFRAAVRAQAAPEALAEEVHRRAQGFAHILHLTSHITEILLRDTVSDGTLSALSKEAEDLGIGPKLDHGAIDTIGQEWRDTGVVFSVRTREVPPAAEIYAEAANLRGIRTAKQYDGPTTAEGCKEPQRSKGIRVLIVDDDEPTLALLEKHLTRSGYDVVKAADGEDALRVLLTEGPPVVITDWMMPKMDGLELCRAIRTHPGISFTYIIIATAFDADEDRIVEALDTGADSFLRKPLRPKELLARLRAAERIAQLQIDLEARRREVHRYNAEMEIANAKLGRANTDLVRMATTDELTGLVNRREALNRLSQHWSAAERNGTPLSIITLDIDHFKQCNDSHGHAAGDAVLKKTAEVFRRTVRNEETVCRIGGEEFLILCPHSTEWSAAVCAERIRQTVEAAATQYGTLTLRVTVSLGVAERSSTMESPDDLLRASDNALYSAKNAGRNTVCSAERKVAAATECRNDVRLPSPAPS